MSEKDYKKVRISISLDERLLNKIDKIVKSDFSNNKSSYIARCIYEKLKRDGALEGGLFVDD